jgi:NAD(P)-dependent dehydrogenase (short-subunit alcohol dehydrogenase family)
MNDELSAEVWSVPFTMSFFYSQLFVKPPYPTKSFEGQTVIVTGSNVGLGFEAVKHFARLSAARIILAVRNVKAGEEAKIEVEKSTNRPGCCEVWQLDLGSFASVRCFGERAASLDRLDVVVENAAIAGDNTFTYVEGHERHITINVISTFLLGLLLIPKLQATSKAFPGSSPRLTCVTSELHAFTKFPERDAPNIFVALDDKENSVANMDERYGTSKLLEIFLMRELAPRIAGTGVTINMVNPGLCHSRLARDLGWGFWMFKQIFARSTEVGSRSLLAGASADTNSHGAYMSDGAVAQSMLSKFVTSKEGLATQEKVWSQMSEILEDIAPGCLDFVK